MERGGVNRGRLYPDPCSQIILSKTVNAEPTRTDPGYAKTCFVSVMLSVITKTPGAKMAHFDPVSHRSSWSQRQRLKADFTKEGDIYFHLTVFFTASQL